MAKTFAKIFGVILLLLGIIGFFSTALVGAGGYFLANAGLEIVNIVLGLALLIVSGTEAGAALWLKIVGIAYALFALIAFAYMTAGTANVLGFMAFNMADGWLYLIGGALMFASGFTEAAGVHRVNVRHHVTRHV